MDGKKGPLSKWSSARPNLKIRWKDKAWWCRFAFDRRLIGVESLMFDDFWMFFVYQQTRMSLVIFAIWWVDESRLKLQPQIDCYLSILPAFLPRIFLAVSVFFKIQSGSSVTSRIKFFRISSIKTVNVKLFPILGSHSLERKCGTEFQNTHPNQVIQSKWPNFIP